MSLIVYNIYIYNYVSMEIIRTIIYTTVYACTYILNLELGVHWWFNYPSPLLDVELEFACLSGCPCLVLP